MPDSMSGRDTRCGRSDQQITVFNPMLRVCRSGQRTAKSRIPLPFRRHPVTRMSMFGKSATPDRPSVGLAAQERGDFQFVVERTRRPRHRPALMIGLPFRRPLVGLCRWRVTSLRRLGSGRFRLLRPTSDRRSESVTAYPHCVTPHCVRNFDSVSLRRRASCPPPI